MNELVSAQRTANNDVERFSPKAPAKPHPPIAIMGIPFDGLTLQDTIAAIEEMIASREPHYLVTANVDFLVQARGDVELRRILADAQLVLCDGTPLVWASRWLGNPLPERVAGSDLVPELLSVAARESYRVFLLGATEESARRAAERLQSQYPSLVLAGYYSPPFANLLEMDHAEIKCRVAQARPDILLVSFGCPKQEKWMWMHYRSLGVPVCIGVGGTIDFLAGHLKRAPRWMRRTGLEWIFRLLQEPRRLFKRYAKDLCIFGWAILPQLWHLQIGRARKRMKSAVSGGDADARADLYADIAKDSAASEDNEGTNLATDSHLAKAASSPRYRIIKLPSQLRAADVLTTGALWERQLSADWDVVLPMQHVRFIDSTGVGLLIKWQKRLRSYGRILILLAPSRVVQRALRLMRLIDFFCLADDVEGVQRVFENARLSSVGGNNGHRPSSGVLEWKGEVTAATVDRIWEATQAWLTSLPSGGAAVIDLASVQFMDSSGLGLMIKVKKHCTDQRRNLQFRGPRPAVLNVVKLAHLEKFLLKAA